ncbi:PREDICTED: serine/threonine-protein phosphatase 7 long form homolog [Ipomoea nil]|uniref:serine/threonine-protein phosphatase 7 long form homolog n=1 Tax=Ipomoea nil TaxID=35883 RepID=UPI000901F74D|nr:PREDICTED: serine/threonine-protein phosphatase 7 long form homolog [Ipomoea nil]
MVRPQGVLPQEILGDLPLAARWNCRHSWRSVLGHVERVYRDQFDRLSASKFSFTPYDNILNSLPHYCKAGQEFWTARVPLIFFYIVEYHYPDRFCRQFHDSKLKGKCSFLLSSSEFYEGCETIYSASASDSVFSDNSTGSTYSSYAPKPAAFGICGGTLTCGVT